MSLKNTLSLFWIHFRLGGGPRVKIRLVLFTAGNVLGEQAARIPPWRHYWWGVISRATGDGRRRRLRIHERRRLRVANLALGRAYFVAGARAYRRQIKLSHEIVEEILEEERAAAARSKGGKRRPAG